MIDKLDELKQRYCNIENLKVCIYCCGEYGIDLYFKLKVYGISIMCFGDLDIKKQGYVLDGIYCKSYDEICDMDKKTTSIVVAIKNDGDIIENFKKQGFTHVFGREEFLEKLNELPQKPSPTIFNKYTFIEFKEELEDMINSKELRNEIMFDDMNQIIIDFKKRNG